jgi:AcrR family transcriptional regulator
VSASVAGATGLSVAELSARTGVPVPTIHHYRRVGLLPEPALRGTRRFVYDDRHVEALRLIRLLRERRRLPLESIRDVLPELLAGELAAGSSPGRTEEADELIASLVEPEGSEPPAALLAAARTAFNERGYDGTSVGELCVAADIAKGTFYRYFSSKEEAFAGVVRSIGSELAEAARGLRSGIGPQGASVSMAEALQPFLPLLLEAMSRELRDDATLQGATAELAEAIAAALATRLRVRAAKQAARSAVREALARSLHRALDI